MHIFSSFQMASFMKYSILFFIVSLLLLPLLGSSRILKPKEEEKEAAAAYIVYFGEHSGEKALHEIEANHHSYLLSVKDNKEHDAISSLLYSYKHTINGFAALLTPQQASKLKDMDEVVSVIPSREYTLHTTRSWIFSGVEEDKPKPNDLVSKANTGKDVIVGVFDSGVWPESQSFNDEGMKPIPKSWKGICQTGPSFNSSHCNKKIIGARYYLSGYESVHGKLNETKDYKSPRDKDGHGSHTASIVGGRKVYNVSAFDGVAKGTASGGAPNVRLAIYKVCWPIPGQGNGNTCFNTDILAAMDDAIADGVDVMSLSLGVENVANYMDDTVAIGALHALKKDIVVSASAGNYGPDPSHLANVAPWIITVGASTVDREFFSNVVLGNGINIQGMSVAPLKLKDEMYPLVYAGYIASEDANQYQAGQCLPNFLSAEQAKGKIVLCLRGMGEDIYTSGLEVKRAGGVGMILADNPLGNNLFTFPHFLPATVVSYADANIILNYINTYTNPEANIAPPTTVYNSKAAPEMAVFSSRGPNIMDPYILKPDITAPGVNILAAWTGENSPTMLPRDIDSRVVEYNLLSGTSMSCPHVSAAAALLKAIHPDWSSAAIKSAIMTTAAITNTMGTTITDGADGRLATPFAYGAGHFQPSLAADPGLVYDANYTDYLHYLCSQGIDNIDKTFKCPKEALPAYNLNYPSIAITNFRGSMSVERTVTNVGGNSSVYKFYSNPPTGIEITATPNVLEFEKVGEKKSFTITVCGCGGLIEVDDYQNSFGWYTWSDGIHNVRSPVALSHV